MPDPYDPLRTSVARWVALSDEQWTALAALFTPREAEAQAHLVLPGTTDHEVLFVTRGLLRFYYPSGDGAEANKAFVAEGEFAGPLAAAALGLPVVYGVQALERTSVLAAPYADFARLVERDAAFERLGRKLAERVLIRKELRTRNLLLLSAKERYRHFVEDRPDLVQRVPLYHIASYLGVTDVHLSRIRRELAQAALSE